MDVKQILEMVPGFLWLYPMPSMKRHVSLFPFYFLFLAFK